jgi:hypothetical protein
MIKIDLYNQIETIFIKFVDVLVVVYIQSNIVLTSN